YVVLCIPDLSETIIMKGMLLLVTTSVVEFQKCADPVFSGSHCVGGLMMIPTACCSREPVELLWQILRSQALVLIPKSPPRELRPSNWRYLCMIIEIKRKKKKGWRVDPVVKSTGPRFDSQNLHSSSKPSTIPVLGDYLMPSSDDAHEYQAMEHSGPGNRNWSVLSHWNPAGSLGPAMALFML
ncbi:hypothetical protein STEG23_022802, partial [Scotinomys teguina]